MYISGLYFHKFPRLHQYLALLELMQIKPNEGKALFVSKGLGKTKIIIDWIRNFSPARVLVIVPKIALKSWKDECNREQFPFYRILSSERHDADWNRPFIVTTYDTVRLMGVNFFTIRLWDAVILDESTKIKYHKAEITRVVCNAFTKIPYRIILSGRPITNTQLDIFSQFLFLDGGASFGNSYSHFQYMYFFMGWNYKWLLSPTYKADFYRKIATKSIVYTSKFMEQNEGRRFPRPITRNIFMNLNASQKRAMRYLFDEFRLVLKGETVYETNWRMAIDQKARQICAGFIYTKAQPIIFSHPKTRALREILDDIPGKVIIFCSFKEEQKLISACIKTWYPRRQVLHLKAGMGIDDIDIVITRHETTNDGILITNAGLARYSLSFSTTQFAIFFTRSFSFETYDQSKARITRLSSSNLDVYYYNLIYRDSIDQIIHESLKQNLSQSEYLNRVVEHLQSQSHIK